MTQATPAAPPRPMVRCAPGIEEVTGAMSMQNANREEIAAGVAAGITRVALSVLYPLFAYWLLQSWGVSCSSWLLCWLPRSSCGPCGRWALWAWSAWSAADRRAAARAAVARRDPAYNTRLPQGGANCARHHRCRGPDPLRHRARERAYHGSRCAPRPYRG